LRDLGHESEEFILPDSMILFSPEHIREVLTNTKAFTKRRSFVGEPSDEAGIERWMDCRKWSADILSMRGISSSNWASRPALSSRAREHIRLGDSVDILASAMNFCAETVGRLSFGNAYTRIAHYFPELLNLLLPLVGRSYSLDAPWQRKHVLKMSEKFQESIKDISQILSQGPFEPGTLVTHLRDLGRVPIFDRALFLLGTNLAGHAVPAGPIAWTIFFVETNPNIKDRLIDELSNKIDRSTYLVACLREAIRLMPPTWLLARDVADLSATKLAIPESIACVYVSSYAIGHSAALFDRPEVFDPLRYLSNECSHSFAFGAGPRACPGQALSMFEAKEYLACLYREYHIHLAVEPKSVTSDSTRTLLPNGLFLNIEPKK
jgi:hypothetical protein